ncbi:Protein virilizer [Macleaya cordata]|uniref:Protein virilizer n=1 Tax=Macleaya cordata TaxID=56857 RepID=A0A200Q9N1_MACCD|nr:Protein virilizer [Macleaya cordata]
MGRPEPSVLFAQTFVHPQLDEYVDEVIFAEPIVITACEFLEQNASSASPVITLIGATSPPSFALEVFVQCEGEPRFRRLCQPFLYSHSSSNVLEVEAVVTSHLVVRGTYRSLTLVVYGNTAEDLGQFNIDFDLDSSLANLVCSSSEGKLEDLPPALHPTKLSLEESIFSLKSLSLPVAEPDLTSEIKQFLHLIHKIFDASDHGDSVHSVVSTIASAVSSFVTGNLHCMGITCNQYGQTNSLSCNKESQFIFTEARSELLELYKMILRESGSVSTELLGDCDMIESDAVRAAPTFELLPNVFDRYFLFKRNSLTDGGLSLSQNKSMIVGLSLVLLLCSGRESCFHFVNSGGMEQLARVFCPKTKKSTAIMLMLLAVVERATRYSIGCEGFLGWWPREDENVPLSCSEGYSQILKLLLEKQRHDVASLATYVLHRLRSYEVASRYESAVLSVLGSLSAVGRVTSVSLNILASAKLQLKKLLKLLNARGPIEDPSPAACASRSLILGQTEGILSYKATNNLIASSICSFSNWDIDPHLLSLLKERGFLPLSAALLSSTKLRSEKGNAMDIFVDIASSIEAILLSLLYSRSGLVFLLMQPEVTATLILSLEGLKDSNTEECVPLRYASVLLSKGFFCRPQEIGIITELHLRVVSAVDRLLTSVPHSEELLWVLWELCGLSRSDSGRQALLALGHFPEAIMVLMEALRSVKEEEPSTLNSESSPLNLAIFHSAAEIFEVIVTDSTASSMRCWIEHAVELHMALHSSSPGSNRKDAPTRLLEWIDAGVVYHRNGAIGLLRYAAVLASGGDAHLTSTSILVSDSMDVENVVGDSANGSNIQVIENLLGKLVSDKYFDGVTLRDSSVAQLTTTFRILSFISENSAVAAALYEEGAVTLIYVVLVNCKFMLERSSNTYDYLVDEGGECNSTSDMLSERSREQSLIDLMIPCLVLLITLLQKLQDAKEQHRNTKLLNALLRLHREVSPKLAACAADLSSPYPGSALGLGAVCHLLVSALACWPVFGWTPGLFHCLLDSVQATSLLALGPKEACSLLCLLGDLFPEEGIWLWRDGMPSLSALRTLAIGTLLGPQKERQVDWYLQPGHVATLLGRLTPLLDKIAQIVLHFASTALVVIQDMLRVFIIRIACQKADCAVVLLQPIISWIDDHVSESTPLSDTDVFKVVYRLLDFIASLLEHPRAKTLLLKEGAVGLLTKALKRCVDASISEGKIFSETRLPARTGFTLLSWCLPVFKSFALIFASQVSMQHSGVYENLEKLSTEDCSVILNYILKLCQVLPVGKELLGCLIVFKGLAACAEGRNAFASISVQIQSSNFEKNEPERRQEQDGNDGILYDFDWRRPPPLLYCYQNLLRSIDCEDSLSTYAIEAVSALFVGALCFCMEGKNLDLERISVLKYLFGLPFDLDGMEHFPEDKYEDACELIALLDTRVNEGESFATSNMKTILSQVKEMTKSLLMLLEKPTGSIKLDDIIFSDGFPFLSSDVLDVSKFVLPHYLFPSLTMRAIMNEDARSSISWSRKSDGCAEKADDYFSLGGLADKFMWECPDLSPDRLATSALPLKRKMTSMEGPNRRSRGDNSGAEVGPNAFSRGSGPPTASSGPTRRDTFRQRKPNTSRPPSMHVDDYVARERNVDGVSSGSNVISSVQRGGSTGGRPPSIHVDEFMARQRERQIPVAMAIGETTSQVRNAPAENENGPEKLDRSRQLKADLDDDLQGIDIVFDGDESESDDRLPFLQPDDNSQPAPVIIEESSPHSIVEETESDVNGSTQVSNLGTPSASNADENTPSEFSSKRSFSRPEMPLSREASVSSEKKYYNKTIEKPFFREQSDDSKNSVPIMASSAFDSATTANLPGLSAPFYNKGSASSLQGVGDSRMPPNFYRRDSPHQASSVTLTAGSQGRYDQKPLLNQPPLPPVPPPHTVSSVISQNAETVQSHSSPYGYSMRDAQPPLPTGYPLQAFDVQMDYLSTYSHGSATSTIPHPIPDSKYSWASVSSGSRLHDDTNSSAGGSARPPQPPLPPTPPPFSASSFAQTSIKSSTSQSTGYSHTSAGINQLPLTSTSPLTDVRLGSFSLPGGGLTSYSPPALMPPLLISRSAAISGTVFSGPHQHQGPSPSTLSHTSSSPSMQPRLPLQPLQPPQPPHPHPPQHLRPPIQVSQLQSDQGLSLLQTPIQVQGQPYQIQQQPHISPLHVYYQSQPTEHLVQPQLQQQIEQNQQQTLHQLGDTASQQQQDSNMSLQQYFASPEAIQSLLSDREKLCQLLEQHPKLMQMLQSSLTECGSEHEHLLYTKRFQLLRYWSHLVYPSPPFGGPTIFVDNPPMCGHLA